MTALSIMKTQAGNRMIGTFVILSDSGFKSRITSHYKDVHEFRLAINNKMWPGSTLLRAELGGKDETQGYKDFISDLPF